MSKILLYIVAVIVLGGAAFYIYTRAPRLPELQTATTTAMQGTQMTQESINEDTDTYTVNAKYPQFGIPTVDAKIKSEIENAVAEFKSYPANPPDSAVPKSEFDSDAGGFYVGPDVVSVALQISEYTGGAHPNTVIDAVNIDPRTGKELTLDDALALTGLSLQEVASSSLAQLSQKLGSDMIFPEGAQPTPENYAAFLINAKSVTFIFQNYQVAPYSAGIQETSFPRK